MSLYDFDKYNKNHIGEDYIFVWNDKKGKNYSFEAYFMKWNGYSHEVLADGLWMKMKEMHYITY